MFLFGKKKKKQYVVAFDVDGVLNDMHDFKIKQGNVFAKKYGCKLENPNSYSTKDMFGWSKDTEIAFWKLYLPQITNVVKPRDGVYFYLNKLLNEDVLIYMFDTSIEETYGDDKILRKQKHVSLTHWLKKNQLYYDRILTTSYDRMSDIQNYKINALVTDKSEVAEKVAVKNQVYLFDNTYNQGMDGVNIKRVYSFEELVNEIIKNKEV